MVALDGMQKDFILPDWPDILTALPVAVGMYVLSLVDTIIANRKMGWRQGKPDEKL